MAISKAQQKATKKYQDLNYDNILVRFPKGTKERIQATGESVNGYIVKTILKELDGKN